MMSIAARLIVPFAAVLLVACGSESGVKVSDIRGGETMALRISFEPAPIPAREKIRFRVLVQDRESGQPIENGWGQVYSTSADGKSIYDNLVPGPELGTYYGTLNFLTAGTWAAAVRFRRDSLSPLETVTWMLDVRAERNPEF